MSKPWAWARSGTAFHMADELPATNVAGRILTTATVSCRDDIEIHAPETMHPRDFGPGDQACLRCLENLRRRADWLVELHELARLTRD